MVQITQAIPTLLSANNMRIQKFITASFILFGLNAFSQVTTEPAEDIDPEQPLKIIVDITQFDASQEHVQNLQADAAAGLDLYIWTWSPYEFPTGHAKANGTGAAAWKSSNELLKMTKEAENIYSYTLTPTEFYEVDAATVYEKDISFLVKPKDGGGYGDPDRKSDDLTIPIDPPKLERDPAYIFPEAGSDDDIFTIYYNNADEQKEDMQDLEPQDCYVYATATLSDSTEVKIAPNFFTVGTYPELQMEYIGDGMFRKFIYPTDFFEVPEGKTITKMLFVVMKSQYLSGKDRIDYDVTAVLGCD